MMNNQHGLSENTVNKILGVFAQFSAIEKAVLYGSRAKGNFKTGSDIDLTLYGENLSSDLLEDIVEALDDLLLPYTIDLSIFDDLTHVKLREHIERVGVVFYEKKKQGVGMKKGWEVKKLGEICEKITDGTHVTPKYMSKGIPFLSVKNLTKGFIDFSDTRFISPEEHKLLTKRVRPEKEDILYTKVGTTGIAKVIDVDVEFSIFVSVALLKIKHDIIFNKYLEYFLNSPFARKQAQKRTRGTANKNLVINDIKEIEIYFPKSIPEQQRLVALLDEVFAAIATAKANAEQNLKNAKELFESYLQGVFDKKRDDWEEKTLGELATFRNGINFTKSSKGEKINIVGVKDFQNNFWVPFETLETVTLDGKLNDLDLLKEGDILAVRSNGNPQLIGRILLASEVVGKVSHSGFTIRIRLKTKNIDPIYLCNYLKISKTRKVLVDGGNGMSIKSLNQGSLSALLILFPPLKAQQAIVAKLDALSAETKKLEAIYQKKINDLEELKKSVLQKAFKGEL